MMTKNQVSDRIEKKNQDIEKINRRIKKWSQGLSSKDIEMAIGYGTMDYSNPLYKQTRQEFKDYVNKNFSDVSYSVSYSNIDELSRAYADLTEAQNTLAKYEVQMNEITNYENEDKIEVLVEFLKTWREKAYIGYMNNALLFIKLKKEEDAEFKKFIIKQKELSGKQISSRDEYNYLHSFKRSYYSEINSITKEFASYYKVDTDKLNKFLDDEVVAKYKDLVQRITKVVGEIKDVSNLSIGNQSGEINGVVKGTLGKANVETIFAGGWNIQIAHYRVLVHEMK